MALPPRLLTSTAVSVLGRAAGTALSVITVGVVTRSLAAEHGVSAYGFYATVFVFLGVAAVVADGGLYLTFTRHAAGTSARQERALFIRVLSLRLLTLTAALGVLSLVVVRGDRYPPSVRQGILLGSLGISAQLVTQLSLGVFQKRLRMLAPALSEVFGRALTLVLALLSAWRGGATILSYVGAFVGGACATLAGNLLAARRLLAADIAARRAPVAEASSGGSLPRIRTLLAETWPIGLLLIFSFIVFRVDSLLLSVLRPPEDLGWYSLPYKVLESLLFFPAMIGGLLFPVFSRSAPTPQSRSSGRQEEGLRASVAEATTLYLSLALPFVTVLYLTAPWSIGILGGPAFSASVPVMQILAIALGALFLGNLYGNAAIALGAQRSLLKNMAVLAVLNVSVNLLVIPKYSYIGAAWTTLGTEILSALMAGWIVARRVGTFFPASAHWHVLSAGGALVLGSLLPFALFTRVVLSLLAYGGVLWLLGVVTPRGLHRVLRAQRLGAPGSPATEIFESGVRP